MESVLDKIKRILQQAHNDEKGGPWNHGTCGETEVEMTFKVVDIANEAQLIEIADRLSAALSEQETPARPLDLSPDWADFAAPLDQGW